MPYIIYHRLQFLPVNNAFTYTSQLCIALHSVVSGDRFALGGWRRALIASSTRWREEVQWASARSWSLWLAVMCPASDEPRLLAAAAQRGARGQYCSCCLRAYLLLLLLIIIMIIMILVFISSTWYLARVIPHAP